MDLPAGSAWLAFAGLEQPGNELGLGWTLARVLSAIHLGAYDGIPRPVLL